MFLIGQNRMSKSKLPGTQRASLHSDTMTYFVYLQNHVEKSHVSVPYVFDSVGCVSQYM